MSSSRSKATTTIPGSAASTPRRSSPATGWFKSPRAQDGASRSTRTGSPARPIGRRSWPECLRLLRGAQALGVDVDDQGREQDQAADQDFQEAVDVDMVQAVVEHAQHEQADDGVGDAALAAEQARAAHDHGGNGIEQVVVELVLLGAAEMG